MYVVTRSLLISISYSRLQRLYAGFLTEGTETTET
jgi:hypothetical protein